MKKLTLFLFTAVAVWFAATYALTVSAAANEALLLSNIALDAAPTPDPARSSQMLSEHNVLRQKYNVAPLVWDNAIAAAAQAIFRMPVASPLSAMWALNNWRWAIWRR